MHGTVRFWKEESTLWSVPVGELLAGQTLDFMYPPTATHTHTHTTHTYTLSNVQYSEAFHIHFCGAQIVSNEQNF